MITEKFLRCRRGARLTAEGRQILEGAVSDVRDIPARKTLVEAGQLLSKSTLLVEGLMCRYRDDRNGLRQLLAVHVPGDFVDLHGYPLKTLEHDVASLTPVKIAEVPHRQLDDIITHHPSLTASLWYATLLDAAIHREWLFRLGRLDAQGRIAHFLCETNARLAAVGLSDGRSFDLPITQADLAEICGLTSVHINRVMRSLREERVASFRSSRVEIHDPAGLRRRGQFDPDYLYIDADCVSAREAV